LNKQKPPRGGFCVIIKQLFPKYFNENKIHSYVLFESYFSNNDVSDYTSADHGFADGNIRNVCNGLWF
jgi:hypothetical protein